MKPPPTKPPVLSLTSILKKKHTYIHICTLEASNHYSPVYFPTLEGGRTDYEAVFKLFCFALLLFIFKESLVLLYSMFDILYNCCREIENK